MNLASIIQARMSSSRLPGKVLKEAGGKTILGRMLDRVRKSERCKRFIVATSADESDRPIEDFCKKYGVECFRGSLSDVAKRFLETIERYKLDAFVRLSADSPFMDARIIDGALEIFRTKKKPIVTNTFKRSFPKGQSVEVFDAVLFAKYYPEMKAQDEFEHVTQFFYKRPGQFEIENFLAPHDYSGINLCVDTQADFDCFAKVLELLGARAENVSWLELIPLYKKLQPEKAGKEK